MGLGADRSKVVQDQNEKRGGRHAKDSQAEEELIIKKGASCLIEKGRHEDLYGKVSQTQKVFQVAHTCGFGCGV